MSTPDGASATSAGERPKYAMLAMVIVAFASFMDLLDVGIVTVVVPVMQKDLGASYTQGQWFLIAYVVAFAVVLVTGGRLGDLYGRKRIFQIGVAGFTLMSLLCTLAQSPEMLIATRLLQGGFGALMTPQVFALMQTLFPPNRRGLAFMIYGGVINLGQLAAPFLGGLLTTYDVFGLGWRLIFAVNVPVGILILVGAGLLVRESKSEHPLRLDRIGIVLVALVTGLVMYPLNQGREAGWPGWMLVMLVAAVPLLALFVWFERRRGHDAVVPMSLFTLRSFSAASFLLLLFFSTIASANLVIVWFTQIALQWSTLKTAFSLVGFVFGLLAVGGVAALKVDKLGRAFVALGSVTTAVGMATISVLIGNLGGEVQPWHLLIGFFVVGCGMSFVVGLLVNAQLYDVPPGDAGAAGGVLSAVIQFGTAAGVGIVSVIFFGFLAAGGPAKADNAVPDLRAALAAQGLPADRQAKIEAEFKTCFTESASAVNPFALPASCQSPDLANPAVGAQLGTARTANFAGAASETLWYQVGALVVSAALAFLLPRKRPVRPDADSSEGTREPQPSVA